jgi:RNA 2',3'-cyclic 3'-phosphodiesterase
MNRQIHRLFFALRPPAPQISAIAQAAGMFKASGLVRGSWVASSKYHVTLHFLGDHSVLPLDIIENAMAAASSLRHAPFDTAFDSISSFRGRSLSPCVLRCSRDADAALQSFWRDLGSVLIACGLGKHLERRFTPHVTIAYGDKTLAEPIAIDPIIWTISEFVLIDSLVGKSIHNQLGSWMLAG